MWSVNTLVRYFIEICLDNVTEIKKVANEIMEIGWNNALLTPVGIIT